MSILLHGVQDILTARLQRKRENLLIILTIPSILTHFLSIVGLASCVGWSVGREEDGGGGVETVSLSVAPPDDQEIVCA